MPSNKQKTVTLHRDRRARAGAILAIVLVAATALAGCHDFIGDDNLSYDEARASTGTVLEPEEDNVYRMGVIHPETPDNVSTGRLDVVVLLYDPVEDVPVENASIAIEGHMPMHGHGTSPEGDPAHEGNGVYSGFTTLGMGGMWHVYLNVTLPAGGPLEFMLPVHVMGDDDMDDMDDMDHGDMDDEDHDMDNLRSRTPVVLRAFVGPRTL